MRKKIKVIPVVVVTLSITLITLLIPNGKVLFRINFLNSFPITQGAFLKGLQKSAVLSGTVFLSRIFISKKILLPGTIGALISKTFFYFEKLTEKKIDLKSKNILKNIDARLCEIWNEEFA